jgi:hypothetical protein
MVWLSCLVSQCAKLHVAGWTWAVITLFYLESCTWPVSSVRNILDIRSYTYSDMFGSSFCFPASLSAADLVTLQFKANKAATSHHCTTPSKPLRPAPQSSTGQERSNVLYLPSSLANSIVLQFWHQHFYNHSAEFPTTCLSRPDNTQTDYVSCLSLLQIHINTSLLTSLF